MSLNRYSILAPVLLLNMTLPFTTSADSGGSNGGGGDTVTLPDGSTVLADPFLDHTGPQPGGLPPIRSLHPRLIHVMGDIVSLLKKMDGNDACPVGSKDCNVFPVLDDFVSTPAHYRIFVVQTVAEMANFCATGGAKKYTLPDGAKVNLVACTQGADTFLIESEFRKLGLIDQALLMVHERLTTLRDSYGGRNFDSIAKMIGGLKAALTYVNAEEQNKSPLVSDQDRELIREMHIGLAELQDMNSSYAGNNSISFSWEITSGGGKVQPGIALSNSAYVDLFSKVDGEPRRVCASGNCSIGDNVSIRSSRVRFYPGRLKLTDNQVIDHTLIRGGFDNNDLMTAAEADESTFQLSWTWTLRDAKGTYFDIIPRWYIDSRYDTLELHGLWQGRVGYASHFHDADLYWDCSYTHTVTKHLFKNQHTVTIDECKMTLKASNPDPFTLYPDDDQHESIIDGLPAKIDDLGKATAMSSIRRALYVSPNGRFDEWDLEQDNTIGSWRNREQEGVNFLGTAILSLPLPEGLQLKDGRLEIHYPKKTALK